MAKKQETTSTEEKSLKDIIASIEKDFGKGSLMKLSDKPSFTEGVIPTGSLKLDLALGIDGLPRGRIVEIYGPESSGKTTVATSVIAQAQKNGGLCAVIDVEHAFDTDYARQLGVDVDNLYFNQPATSEEALEVADRLVASGKFAVVLIDSVAAMVPKKELENQMGDSSMGVQARLMSQALRKMTGSVSKTNTLVIFINQLREKIGVMFGNPETTTGGNALKFYASVRLDIRRVSIDKDGDDAFGTTIKIKVVKNKVAPPFKVAEISLIFGEGIDVYSEVIDLGVELGIIAKSGSWYSYEEGKLGQGKDGVKEILKDNDELYQEIFTKIKTQLSKLKNKV